MRVLSLLCLLAGPAGAQGLSAAEADVLPRIIDTLCLDMVEARLGCETAILLRGTTPGVELQADLVILSDRREDDDRPPEVLAVKRGIAFDGPMFGQAPALEAAGSSLRITSEQTGIGRSPWTQVLTVAHRGGAFVAAGFTYSVRDRLTTATASCDVNLLTGGWETVVTAPEGTSERRTGRIDARRGTLADWAPEPMPKPCAAALDRFWSYR